MIVKNNTDIKVEGYKNRLGLTGDVYLVEDVFIESLESHKRLIPTSTATTIAEAEQERIAYEAEQAEARRIAAEQAALMENNEGGSESISDNPEEDTDE